MFRFPKPVANNHYLSDGNSQPAKDMYMLSGCELIDSENISLSSQNMKFGGE
jgi:hypothetical protein